MCGKLGDKIQKDKELTKGQLKKTKIWVKFQSAAEEATGNTWKLPRVDENKHVWIKKDKTREETHNK